MEFRLPRFLRALVVALAAGAMPFAAQAGQPIHDQARMGTGEEVARTLKANPALRDAHRRLAGMREPDRAMACMQGWKGLPGKPSNQTISNLAENSG